MKAVVDDDRAVSLKPPPGAENIGTLPIMRLNYGGYDVLTSCWMLDDQDIHAIMKHRRVWLMVITQQHPPVLLTTVRPYGVLLSPPTYPQDDYLDSQREVWMQ